MAFEIEEEPPATSQCPQLPVQGSTVPGQPHSVAASSCSSASPAGLQQGTALHSAEPQQLWPEPISLLPFPSPALPSPHHWVKSTQEIQHMGKDGANKPPLASFPLGLGLLKKGVWDVIAFPWGVIGAVGCLRTSPSLPTASILPHSPKLEVDFIRDSFISHEGWREKRRLLPLLQLVTPNLFGDKPLLAAVPLVLIGLRNPGLFDFISLETRPQKAKKSLQKRSGARQP